MCTCGFVELITDKTEYGYKTQLNVNSSVEWQQTVERKRLLYDHPFKGCIMEWCQ